MGDLKIVGPDGKPLPPPPSKDNPDALKAAAAALNQPRAVARIDLLPDGTFGLKPLVGMPAMDFAFILSNLLFTLLATIKNQQQNLQDAQNQQPPGNPT